MSKPEVSALKEEANLKSLPKKDKAKNIEIPAPKLTNSGDRRSSALSLNSLHKKAANNKKDSTSEVDIAKLPVEAFTQADLYVFWKKYIAILDKQGDKMLSSILLSSEPVLQETVLHLTYPNAMMLEEVKKSQAHILNYLRSKLKNYQISFNLILNEEDEKKYVYTPEEKYNKLREINPIVDDFRKAFHLDL